MTRDGVSFPDWRNAPSQRVGGDSKEGMWDDEKKNLIMDRQLPLSID